MQCLACLCVRRRAQGVLVLTDVVLIPPSLYPQYYTVVQVGHAASFPHISKSNQNP